MSVPPGVHHAPSGSHGPAMAIHLGEVDPLNRSAERASIMTRIHPPAQEVDMMKKRARRVYARCIACGMVARVHLDDMNRGGAACPVLCVLGAYMVKP